MFQQHLRPITVGRRVVLEWSHIFDHRGERRLGWLDAIRRCDVRPCRVDECTEARHGRHQLRGLRSKGRVLRQGLHQVVPFDESFLEDDSLMFTARELDDDEGSPRIRERSKRVGSSEAAMDVPSLVSVPVSVNIS